MKIRVLSYNIHKGMTLGNRVFILNKIKQGINTIHPDIVFLQEVVGDHRHQNKRIEDWPTNAQFEFLADELWPHFAYGKNAIYDEGHHGNAILSKYPIVSWDNTDISVNSLEYRGLIHAKINLPETNQKLDLFCTHLNLLHADRLEQIEKIIQTVRLKTTPLSQMILAGDFNDWRNKLSIPLAENLSLKEAFVSLRGVPARSFPTFMPFLPLDRIYYRGIQVTDGTVLTRGIWGGLSDHLPLQVTFEIPAPILE